MIGGKTMEKKHKGILAAGLTAVAATVAGATAIVLKKKKGSKKECKKEKNK